MARDNTFQREAPGGTGCYVETRRVAVLVRVPSNRYKIGRVLQPHLT